LDSRRRNRTTTDNEQHDGCQRNPRMRRIPLGRKHGCYTTISLKPRQHIGNRPARVLLLRDVERIIDVVCDHCRYRLPGPPFSDYS